MLNPRHIRATIISFPPTHFAHHQNNTLYTHTHPTNGEWWITLLHHHVGYLTYISLLSHTNLWLVAVLCKRHHSVLLVPCYSLLKCFSLSICALSFLLIKFNERLTWYWMCCLMLCVCRGNWSRMTHRSTTTAICIRKTHLSPSIFPSQSLIHLLLARYIEF